MKSRWITLSCGIVCLAACNSSDKTPDDSSGDKADPVPTHFFIEAESHGTAGKKIADAHASASFYVKRQSGDFQAVIVSEVPPSEKTLTVWIRRKGGPVQMVLSTNGEQQASPWVSEVEDRFVWVSCGEIEPGEAGRELIFIGNDDISQSVSLDCILFTEGSIADMDALLTPLPAISIDPEKTAGSFRTVPFLWGKEIISSSDSEDIAYQAPRFVRFRNYGMFADDGSSSDSFLEPDSHKLDEEKIQKFVSGLLALGNTREIILNIPNWPRWMDTNSDGFLDDDKVPDYAELIGSFAEIVMKIPGASGRVLFEITDGMDGAYHRDLVAAKKPHRVAELGRIFLIVAQRVREVFPESRIGGVSAQDGNDLEFHEQFIALTAPELDFYSMRLKTNSDTQAVGAAQAILAKNSKGRDIPLFIIGTDATRIPETSKPVYEAWFLLDLLSSGAEYATAPPTLKGSASHLYHVLNTEFAGPVARLETDEPEDISALTPESGNRILLSHRGLRERKITLPEGKWTGWMLGQSMEVPQEITVDGEVDLPGVALMYLEK